MWLPILTSNEKKIHRAVLEIFTEVRKFEKWKKLKSVNSHSKNISSRDRKKENGT